MFEKSNQIFPQLSRSEIHGYSRSKGRGMLLQLWQRKGNEEKTLNSHKFDYEFIRNHTRGKLKLILQGNRCTREVGRIKFHAVPGFLSR